MAIVRLSHRNIWGPPRNPYSVPKACKGERKPKDEANQTRNMRTFSQHRHETRPVKGSRFLVCTEYRVYRSALLSQKLTQYNLDVRRGSIIVWWDGVCLRALAIYQLITIAYL